MIYGVLSTQGLSGPDVNFNSWLQKEQVFTVYHILWVRVCLSRVLSLHFSLSEVLYLSAERVFLGVALQLGAYHDVSLRQSLKTNRGEDDTSCVRVMRKITLT